MRVFCNSAAEDVMRKRSKYTEEQLELARTHVKAGLSVEKACEKADITVAAYYRRSTKSIASTPEKSNAFGIDLDNGPFAFRTLEQWEKKLRIPARTLLHHATQGRLAVFVQRPFQPVRYFIVRTDPTASPLEEASLVPLSNDELAGFVPSTDQLEVLIRDGVIKVDAFENAICRNLYWDPCRGLHPGAPWSTVRPVGWLIRAYAHGELCYLLDDHNSTTPLLLPTDGTLPDPVTFYVRPDQICIRDRDITSFLSALASYSFISDLFLNMEFTSDPPTYLSAKLIKMIEVSKSLWKEPEKNEVVDFNRTRGAVLSHLGAAFRELSEDKDHRNLVKFAANICDPTVDPSSNYRNSRVPTKLLTLLTAAKLYWSPTYVRAELPGTHPAKPEMEYFLRRDFDELNDASGAATLIRPECSKRGRPIPMAPFFKPCLDPQGPSTRQE